MRCPLFRIILLLALCFVPYCMKAQSLSADSLVGRVYTYTQREGLELGEYSADLYMRYLLQTKTNRCGWIMRYLPNLSKVEKGEHLYFGERHVSYSHRSNGIMDWKNLAFWGTTPRRNGLNYEEVSRFNFSVYSSQLLSDRVLSPLNERNKHYYKYYTDSSLKADSAGQVRIKVVPRFHNTQLVEGTMDVDSLSGAVRKFTFNYQYTLTKYALTAYMGREGVASLLPERVSVDYSITILGNKMHWLLDGSMRYSFEENLSSAPSKAIKSRDMTPYYQMRLDTTKMRRDVAYFDSIRPYPLTEKEKAICREALKIDSAKLNEPWLDTRSFLSEQMEDILFDRHQVALGKSGKVKLPAIVTPSMVQWSKSKGLMLQTRIGVEFKFPKGGGIDFGGRVGYNFKQERVYWKVPLNILFSPRVDARFGIEIGNNNDMYSSEQADAVRKKMEHVTNYDSLIRVFDNYEFYYYRDRYLRGQFSVSPVAGLSLSLGAKYHRRTLVEWNDMAAALGMQREISSLSPHFHLEWTPAVRYYWKNNRRVLLGSDFPTFMLDYERGLKVGKCDSDYERWEMDIRYKRDLYALRSLYLRLGAGFYTSRGGSYFLDYEYFHDNNMPSGWEDEMSGQFQVLDSRWYNESKYYVRCSAAFESPMLLFSRIKFLSRAIQKERIYCNLLSVQSLVPYGELGYGLSTHVVDLGAFVGMAKNQVNFGFKFALRLFDEW